MKFEESCVNVVSLLPADLHVRRLARLGGPHVTLPGHSALVFKLPHCQVKTAALCNVNDRRGHVAVVMAILPVRLKILCCLLKTFMMT